jgi:hypothetical protein
MVNLSATKTLKHELSCLDTGEAEQGELGVGTG